MIAHERRAAGLRAARAALRHAGQTVYVESPTYDRPLKILARERRLVVAVQMDDQGLDPGRARGRLAREPDAGVPLHDPDLPEPERAHAARPTAAARSSSSRAGADTLIVEDDPYGLIRFEGEPQPAMFELAGGKIIYTSSFSKTISPGLRVGWYIVPEELAGAADRARELDLHHAGAASQAVVYEFIRRGSFEPNLERINGLLKARRDAMLAALDKHISGCTWSRPEGGYFIWLELPEGTSAKQVLERAEGVTAVLGTDFGGAYNTLRLAYSFVSPEEIDEGVARLAAAVE